MEVQLAWAQVSCPQSHSSELMCRCHESIRTTSEGAVERPSNLSAGVSQCCEGVSKLKASSMALKSYLNDRLVNIFWANFGYSSIHMGLPQILSIRTARRTQNGLHRTRVSSRFCARADERKFFKFFNQRLELFRYFACLHLINYCSWAHRDSIPRL